MLLIPAAIREKKGNLSARELTVMKTHPALSQAFIKEAGFPLEYSETVLAHHERWDGKGYPRRLAGRAIGERAAVITVADAYAALIRPKPYRRNFLGYDALKTILHGVLHQFCPLNVKLLLKSVGIYPLGSLVLLNSFQVGRVVGTREETALRPQLEIIRDNNGRAVVPPPVVDLTEKKELYILKALDPRDLVYT
jgi:HD-GYP domain-containing protein (c-di-GMP phosphodiesterase class II)